MKKHYDEYLVEKQHEYGEKFDPSNLDARFVPFFESGQRIEVTYAWGETRRGYVGVTTGWRPAWLLIHNTRSMGSAYTLDSDVVNIKPLPLWR